MGFSFPVVQKAVQRDIHRLGSRVGLVQLANIVCSNSAGSLVAGLLLLDLVGTANTLKLLAAIGLAFAVLQLAGPRATRWAGIPAAVLTTGLLFFPGDEAFWRRLHGVTSQKAIMAEDKTGLSLLKMSDSQSGRLYIQGQSLSQPPLQHTSHLPRRHRAVGARCAIPYPCDWFGHRGHALGRSLESSDRKDQA